MKRIPIKYHLMMIISLVLIISGCRKISQRNIKYDSLEIVFQYGKHEINSFENKIIKQFPNHGLITIDVQFATDHKRMILNQLEKMNYFNIPSDLNKKRWLDIPYGNIFVSHFGIEHNVSWNPMDLESSIYEEDILELMSVIYEVEEDLLKFFELPERKRPKIKYVPH